MRKIKLSKRLAAIAGYIEAGAAVADIGTDHGYLPVYLAQNGLAAKIAASDIAEGPLDAARRNAERYGVAGKIRFVCAPGLEGIAAGEADTIVISGMGGETIAEILRCALWTRRCGVKLILQPQSKLAELLTWLRENGCAVTCASLVRDGGRLYAIICAAAGCADAIDSAPDDTVPESEIFALLLKKRDPLLPEYLEDLIIKADRAAQGMGKSGTDDYLRQANRAERLRKLAEEANKYAKCERGI